MAFNPVTGTSSGGNKNKKSCGKLGCKKDKNDTDGSKKGKKSSKKGC